MSKRRHYGSSGDTPGKTAPKKVRFLINQIGRVSPMRNPPDEVYFLARAVTVQGDVQLLRGQGKKQQHWWSMWLCIGKEPTATDGRAIRIKSSGRRVPRRLLMLQTYRNEQVE